MLRCVTEGQQGPPTLNVDDQALAGMVLGVEVKVQLGHETDGLLRGRGALKIESQPLFRQAGDGSEAGCLPLYLQDGGQ